MLSMIVIEVKVTTQARHSSASQLLKALSEAVWLVTVMICDGAASSFVLHS